jgi:MSHA pilin protein MshD
MLANKTSGFTLIELVIGIVVFSIALTLFTSLIVPQAVRSVDPIFQVRAAELGQSLINEIIGRSFDETSGRTGGTNICGQDTNPACTSSAGLGPEEGTNNRANFDDVDDYHGFSMPYDSDGDGDSEFTNALGNEITLDGVNFYAGFSLSVSVFYDAAMDGTADTVVGNTKLITVTVTTPNDEDIIFSSFRSNY